MRDWSSYEYDRSSSCLTPADWMAGRDATGRTSRYRWVDPNRRDNCTKEDWPYSYSEHFLWGSPNKGDDAVYSDRLSQWDHEAWQRGWEASGRKRMDQFSSADANKFMSAYYGKKIKVSALAEGCNVSNGYPYFVLWFTDPQ